MTMKRTWRQFTAVRLAALLCAGGLLLGACSDDDGDGGDDGSSTETDAPDETTAGGEDESGDGGGESLTDDDEAELLAAAINGNPDEDYARCITDTVIAAVDAGELTVEEVRAWYGGTGFDGPVQAYISQSDVVIECSASPTTTA
jgi:hypothetical protein